MNNYQDWDPVVIRGKIDKTREKEKYVKFMGQEIRLPKRGQYSGKSPEQKLDEAKDALRTREREVDQREHRDRGGQAGGRGSCDRDRDARSRAADAAAHHPHQSGRELTASAHAR